MSPRGAALVFAVDKARSLTVRTGHPDIKVCQVDISDGEINAVDEELRKALTDIHNLTGDDLEPPEDKAKEALERISSLALRVSYGLFQGAPLGLVQEAARIHAPGALIPKVPPRVVEITTPRDFDYPFELIPWHRVNDDVTDPVVHARALLGMSAIVRRRLLNVSEWNNGSAKISNVPDLPVTVFQHKDFAGAGSEAEYLERVGGIVKVYGPLPKAPGFAKLALVQHLLDSRTDLDNSGHTSPASILHLACHCCTTSTNSDDHEIDVGGADGIAKLGELKMFASKPQAWNAPLPRPLVFLNACASAVPQPASRVSFHDFFLAQHTLGIVGTLCDISDDVAGHFAAVFYESLLKGRSIGAAMYDARWHLMEVHGNPLGLLYTFYGNPDLKVAHPRAGGVNPACTLKESVTSD